MSAQLAEPGAAGPLGPAEVEAIRREFPALAQTVHGKPLVYLDSGATAQTPEAVVEAIAGWYRGPNANVHRGIHHLSQVATDQYEAARATTRRFVGAASDREVIFTRGTTESINLVAQTWGAETLKPGDEIVVTALEHHANIVPWQMVAERTGATVKAIPITERGEVTLEAAREVVTERTKMLAVAHVSNTLGTVLPVRELAELAHDAGALCLIDGAQAAPHMPVDVAALGADFYVFSAHKVYGPTGVGVLWGREALLEAMPPWQGGGAMIDRVSFAGTTYGELPDKFEAGTPNIAGAIGMAAGLEWVTRIGLDHLAAWEHRLLERATAGLSGIPGLTIHGTAPHKAGVLSFTMDEAHPSDIGTLLDRQGVAVRTGHHCTQPLMDVLGVPATARATFGVYNTEADVDRLIEGVAFVAEMFG